MQLFWGGAKLGNYNADLCHKSKFQMSFESDSDSDSENDSADFCVPDLLDEKNKKTEQEVLGVIGEEWKKGPMTRQMRALLQDVNITEAQSKKLEEWFRSGGDPTFLDPRIMMDVIREQSGFENEDIDTEAAKRSQPMSKASVAYLQLHDIITYVEDNWRYMEAERAAKTSRVVIDWGDSDSDDEASDDEASDDEDSDDEASVRKPAMKRQTGDEAAAAMKRQRR